MFRSLTRVARALPTTLARAPASTATMVSRPLPALRAVTATKWVPATPARWATTDGSADAAGAAAEAAAAAAASDPSKGIEDLIAHNKEWVLNIEQMDPTYFKRQANQQAPKYMYIGCSDSRAPANSMLGLGPGELFVQRNVANMVVHSDTNMLAVLQYAVEALKVKDIIVCGHYDCGGVKAAFTNVNTQLDYVEAWVQGIRDLIRLHWDEIHAIPDVEGQLRRTVELNVQEQCVNVLKTTIVQRQHAKTPGFPRVHPVVLDVATGRLKEFPVATLSGTVAEAYTLDAIKRAK